MTTFYSQLCNYKFLLSPCRHCKRLSWWSGLAWTGSWPKKPLCWTLWRSLAVPLPTSWRRRQAVSASGSEIKLATCKPFDFDEPKVIDVFVASASKMGKLAAPIRDHYAFKRNFVDWTSIPFKIRNVWCPFTVLAAQVTKTEEPSEEPSPKRMRASPPSDPPGPPLEPHPDDLQAASCLFRVTASCLSCHAVWRS